MDRHRALLQLKALGEPSRLDLFLRITRGELGGTDLLRSTGLSQPNLSRHIRVLREAGVIQERWLGRNAYYCLSDEPLVLEIARVLGGGNPVSHIPAGVGSSGRQNMPSDESVLEPTAVEPEEVEIARAPLEDWLL